jgi:hypothetical protein
MHNKLQYKLRIFKICFVLKHSALIKYNKDNFKRHNNNNNNNNNNNYKLWNVFPNEELLIVFSTILQKKCNCNTALLEAKKD